MAERNRKKETLINENPFRHDTECDMFSEPSACPECGYVDLFAEDCATRCKCRDCGCEWKLQENGKKKVILHGNLCC